MLRHQVGVLLSHRDAILRLVWASEVCSSKREMEDEGVEFRLISWSE